MATVLGSAYWLTSSCLIILTVQYFPLCHGQQCAMVLVSSEFNIWKVKKALFHSVDFISWRINTKQKPLGVPSLFLLTSTSSLSSPVLNLIILYSKGKQPIYMSTIYQTLHTIFILKVTFWGRSKHPLCITKKTGSGRWSVQQDTTSKWRMERHQV